MNTILRYQFDPKDKIVLRVPINSEPIFVGHDDGALCMFFKANTALPPEDRHYRLIRAGEEWPDMCWYLRSFEVYPNVWHLLGCLPEKVPVEWRGADERDMWKWFGTLQHRVEAIQ